MLLAIHPVYQGKFTCNFGDNATSEEFLQWYELKYYSKKDIQTPGGIKLGNVKEKPNHENMLLFDYAKNEFEENTLLFVWEIDRIEIEKNGENSVVKFEFKMKPVNTADIDNFDIQSYLQSNFYREYDIVRDACLSIVKNYFLDKNPELEEGREIKIGPYFRLTVTVNITN